MTDKLAELVPDNFGRYIEPFLGGGSLFFRLHPWPATLSDLNAELINAYTQVRDSVDNVISHLDCLEISKEQFLIMRESRPTCDVQRAVRFLYLNRTAFNGIYRVNRNGKFNVPFGCKPGTVLCEPVLLREAATRLRNRKLCVCDFEEPINSAEAGDLVFADPPYTTKHDNNGFRRYNEKIFSWDDQIRLADACRKAALRGVNVIVTNANHKPIVDLYEGFDIQTLRRRSLISGSADGRGTVDECVIHLTSE